MRLVIKTCYLFIPKTTGVNIKHIELMYRSLKIMAIYNKIKLLPSGYKITKIWLGLVILTLILISITLTTNIISYLFKYALTVRWV